MDLDVESKEKRWTTLSFWKLIWISLLANRSRVKYPPSSVIELLVCWSPTILNLLNQFYSEGLLCVRVNIPASTRTDYTGDLLSDASADLTWATQQAQVVRTFLCPLVSSGEYSRAFFSCPCGATTLTSTWSPAAPHSEYVIFGGSR